MRYLVILLLFFIPQDDFSVEPLTADEIASLNKAEKSFAEAKTAHDKVLNDIRYAHGQSIWMGFQQCDTTQVTVEIRGRYALIQRTFTGSCVIPANTGAIK